MPIARSRRGCRSGLLGPLCRIAAPNGGLKRRLMSSRRRIIQRIGVRRAPGDQSASRCIRDPEVRVCDTLDWYAPQYLSRHTVDEVAPTGSPRQASSTWSISAGTRSFYHEGQGRGINLAGSRPVAAIGR